jgi:hypothetical protein
MLGSRFGWREVDVRGASAGATTMTATTIATIRTWVLLACALTETGCATVDARSYLERDRRAGLSPLAVKASIVAPPGMVMVVGRPSESMTVASMQLGILWLALLPVSLAVDATSVHSAASQIRAAEKYNESFTARTWEGQQSDFEGQLRQRVAEAVGVRVLGPDPTDEVPAATLDAEVRFAVSTALDVLLVQADVRLGGDASANFFSRFVVLSDPLALPDRDSPEALLALQSTAATAPRCRGPVLPDSRDRMSSSPKHGRWTSTEACRWRAYHWSANGGMHIEAAMAQAMAQLAALISRAVADGRPPNTDGISIGKALFPYVYDGGYRFDKIDRYDGRVVARARVDTAWSGLKMDTTGLWVDIPEGAFKRSFNKSVVVLMDDLNRRYLPQ